MRTILCLLAVTLTCLRCAAQDAGSASIAGVVIAGPGDPVAGAKVEFHSQARTVVAETDRNGHYRLERVASGEYEFRVRSSGFTTYEIKSVRIAAGQGMRMPDTALRVGDLCGIPLPRESVRMLSGTTNLGSLKGSVYLNAPLLLLSPFSRTTVTLACDGDRVCRSTQANLLGKFEFRDLPTGWYALRVSRRGFYSEEESGLPVSGGLEQVYASLRLEKCLSGNCDIGLRRPKICE